MYNSFKSLFHLGFVRCSLNSCNFIKKETLAQVFSCDFCKISNTFFYRVPPVAASVMQLKQTFSFQLRVCFKYVWHFNAHQVVTRVKQTFGAIFAEQYFSLIFKFGQPWSKMIFSKNFAKFTGKPLS